MSVNRRLLDGRMKCLNTFIQHVPEKHILTVGAAWLVMQALAGSKHSAVWWLMRVEWISIRARVHAWSWWLWNIQICGRDPDELLDPDK